MHIEVKLHRTIILSPTVIEDIEMTCSDFVRRDDDHRLALAAMHTELTDALDAAEEAAHERDEPEMRTVAELLKAPAGQRALKRVLDERQAEPAGQGNLNRALEAVPPKLTEAEI